MMCHSLFQPPLNLPLYNRIFHKLQQIKDPRGKETAVADILEDIKILRLRDYPENERILLIDTVIKFGNVDLVKALARKFKKEGFSDDIRYPSAENPEHPYRPVFWLAAIITRQPHVPLKNYRDIENYLCRKFAVPKVVQIRDEFITREQYLAEVDAWKHCENIRLFQRFNRQLPRYRRHELMDAIEKGVRLRKV